MSQQCNVCGGFDMHESWCAFATMTGTTTGNVTPQEDDAAVKELINEYKHSQYCICDRCLRELEFRRTKTADRKHDAFCTCDECVKPAKLAIDVALEAQANMIQSLDRAVERIIAAIDRMALCISATMLTVGSENVCYNPPDAVNMATQIQDNAR